jgi:hypothetical protein
MHLEFVDKKLSVVAMAMCDCGIPGCDGSFAISSLRKTVAEQCPGAFLLWKRSMEGIMLSLVEAANLKGSEIKVDFEATHWKFN